MTSNEIRQMFIDALGDIAYSVDHGSSESIRHRMFRLQEDIDKENERQDAVRRATSPEAVKKLREESGMGMMACKKALHAAEGDHDLAMQKLRGIRT